MAFSQRDVIGYERRVLKIRRENKGSRIWSRAWNAFLFPRNPRHTFTFYVPNYIFIRSKSFCDDVTIEIERKFDQSDLARILYTDFLEYVRRTNDIHTVHKRLMARTLTPTDIKPYSTDEVRPGIAFEEIRGFDPIITTLEHRAALKGEFLLMDMLDAYPDHGFVLENILEIVYCDFIDDYRKSLIKNPIDKITQYI